MQANREKDSAGSERGYPFHPVKLAGAALLGISALSLLLSGRGGTPPNTPPGTVTTTPAQRVQVSAPTLERPAGPLTAGNFDLSGTGTPGSTIRVRLDGQEVGRAPVSGDGSFGLTLTLREGARTVVAEAVDGSGKVLAPSAPLALTVIAASSASKPTSTASSTPTTTPGDSTTPANPTTPAPQTPTPSASSNTPTTTPETPSSALASFGISTPADNAALEWGPFTLSGRAPGESSVQVLEDDRALGRAAVAADGTWSYQVTPSSAGDHVYTARAGGSTARLSLSVRPKGLAAGTLIPCPCNLRMTTTPSSAVVTVFKAGRELERQSGPVTLFERLDAGEYTYNVYVRGFRSYNGSFSLPKNRAISVYLDKR